MPWHASPNKSLVHQPFIDIEIISSFDADIQAITHHPLTGHPDYADFLP
ncbi:hypothetical protein [Paenibacillus sp. DS2015]